MSSDQGEASGPGQASHQSDQAELGVGRNLLYWSLRFKLIQAKFGARISWFVGCLCICWLGSLEKTGSMHSFTHKSSISFPFSFSLLLNLLVTSQTPDSLVSLAYPDPLSRWSHSNSSAHLSPETRHFLILIPPCCQSLVIGLSMSGVGPATQAPLSQLTIFSSSAYFPIYTSLPHT